MPASRALILRKRVELNVHPSQRGFARRVIAGVIRRARRFTSLNSARRTEDLAHASLGAALSGACGTAI
jgi:hypothetical protein